MVEKLKIESKVVPESSTHASALRRTTTVPLQQRSFNTDGVDKLDDEHVHKERQRQVLIEKPQSPNKKMKLPVNHKENHYGESNEEIMKTPPS